MSDLSVVIPSWNTRDLLRACLISLANAWTADDERPEVVVVDNASQDGSADMVAAEFPEVHLIRNARNEGFARGCNQGIAESSGGLVLLLNADTEIVGDALARLQRFLALHPEYGAAAPRLVNPDGSTQGGCMAFPNLETVAWFGTPLERWFPENHEVRRYFMRDWDHEDERDVDQPPAACLLVRRAVLDQIGAFDEDLWLFFNDVDLSKRMRSAGWRTRYLPGARVVHHVGRSTRQFGDRVAEWQRNRLTYYRKHHGRPAGWWVKLWVAVTWFDWIVRNLLARLRGDPSEPLGSMTRAFAGFLLR